MLDYPQFHINFCFVDYNYLHCCSVRSVTELNSFSVAAHLVKGFTRTVTLLEETRNSTFFYNN